jgi:hypothetical protein
MFVCPTCVSKVWVIVGLSAGVRGPEGVEREFRIVKSSEFGG